MLRGYDGPIEVPEELAPAVAALIDTLRVNLLLEYVRDHQREFKGYTVKEKNAQHFRKVLKNEFLKSLRLPVDLAAVLYSGARFTTIIYNLSVSALRRNALTMLKIYAEVREEFLGALYLDQRTDVHGLATELAAVKLPEGEEAYWDAMEEYAWAFEAFAKNFCVPLLDALKKADDFTSGREELTKTQEKIRELEMRLEEGPAAELKGLGRKVEKAERKAAARKEAVKKAIDNCRRLKAELENVKAALSASRAEVGSLKASFEGDLAAALERELSAKIRPWLTVPEDLKARVEALDSTANLSERAEGVLALQAETDRHFGNRAKMSEELKRLSVLITKVEEAQKEALNPLPELADLHGDLLRAISGLKETLYGKQSEPMGNFAKFMLIRINEAMGQADLLKIENFLTNARGYSALSLDEEKALKSALEIEKSRLADAHSTFLPKPFGRTAVWRYSNILEGDAPFTLLVDGKNTMLELVGRYGSTMENGYAGRSTREALVGDVAAVVNGSDNGHAVVVFDSSEYESVRHSERIEVVFSGGGDAPDRADGVLIERCNALAADPAAGTLLMVTSDGGLRQRAIDHGALVATPEEFEPYLTKATGKESHDPGHEETIDRVQGSFKEKAA